ncbi:MAG: Asp-tRNA(Asn)/Glu-tRNA(Gln) amidotransferase subunit GatC [Gemmatimonadota bacterium]
MTKVDLTQVRHVARLARLELDETEVERLAEEMSVILGHFEALADVEAEGSRRPVGRGLETRLRADEPDPDPLARAPQALAPEWRDGLFLVPRLPAMDAATGES